MIEDGAGPTRRRGRIGDFWAERRSRWTLPLVIIVVIIVVATVDHLGAHRISQVEATSNSDLVAVRGGTATVELQQPWDGFNPNTPAGAGSSTPTLLVSVLPSAFVINPHLLPMLNNNLLKSVEVTSTSPLTIQYVLNPAAVWSDGVPVSAEDFIYAWQCQRGAGVDVDGQAVQVASTLGYQDIGSVTGSQGGKTVTVVFTTPFTDWRVLFDEMVPAHIAEKVGWNAGFTDFDPTRELSAGPMILRSVSSNGTAVLARNPAWWGGRASLDKVEVSVSSSEAAVTAGLGASNEVVAEPSQFDLGLLNTVSALPNTQSILKPSLDFIQVEFNVASAATSEVALRQAIAHTIDRQLLLQQTFATIAPDLVVSQNHLAVATQQAYAASTASVGYNEPDLSATARLLESAGYHKGSDGRYVDLQGKPLTVHMAVESGDPWITGVGAAIAIQLQQAGITVISFPVDGVVGLATALDAGAYDMALVTRTASPFQSATEGWYSHQLGPNGPGGSQNWSNFDDPQVDQLFSEAAHGIRELNPVTGATVYAQIDDQLWDQMVALPLFQEPALVTHGVQIENVLYNPSADGLLWNLRTWSTLEPKPPTAAP